MHTPAAPFLALAILRYRSECTSTAGGQPTLESQRPPPCTASPQPRHNLATTRAGSCVFPCWVSAAYRGPVCRMGSNGFMNRRVDPIWWEVRVGMLTRTYACLSLFFFFFFPILLLLIFRPAGSVLETTPFSLKTSERARFSMLPPLFRSSSLVMARLPRAQRSAGTPSRPVRRLCGPRMTSRLDWGESNLARTLAFVRRYPPVTPPHMQPPRSFVLQV